MSPRLDKTRWLTLMASMGLPDLSDTFNHLDRAHAERHRAYHTAEHIRACFRRLDERYNLARRPDRIELALWFHDAVYKPMSKTNEADSAALARDQLAPHLSEGDLDWIDQAICLTQTHGETTDSDTRLLLDIDLSILGANHDVYDTYRRNIRQEYKWVPGPLYRKGRRTVLEHFLSMDHIYKRAETRADWEAQARDNLSRELEQLNA